MMSLDVHAQTTGDAIAAAAERWVGTPFHWQASLRGVGVDCKGLVAGVARDCGRAEAASLEALAGDYGPVVDSARLLAGLARLFDRAALAVAGDLLLLHLHGKPQHLAIAAPHLNAPSRAIQAVIGGPSRVMAVRVPRATVHSIWRWRD